MVGVASRPGVGEPRADLLLRPPRRQGPLQAGLPRRRVGGHPTAGRRADVHDPVQPARPTSTSTGRRTSRSPCSASACGRTSRRRCRPGTDSLLCNAELLTKVAFPRIVAPIADARSRVRSTSRVAAVLAIVVALASGRRRTRAVGSSRRARRSGSSCSCSPSPGPACCLSASVVKYRERRRWSAFGVQLLLFASPVAYPPELVPEPWRTLLYLNPLAGALGLLRCGARRHRPADGPQLAAVRRPSPCSLRRRPAPLPAQRARVRGHHLMASSRHRARRRRQALPPRRAPRHRDRPPRDRRPASPAGSAAAAPEAVRELWSLRDVSFTVDEGSGARHHRLQRRRQEHAAQGHQQHHDADRGPVPHPRPGRLAARGRHRLPRRADRAREHLPERRDPRHDPARGAARLDEIVDFAGLERVHGHAGQALLVGHVPAARLRHRRPHGGRDPARRRGARRRRRRVPAALPREDERGRAQRPHRAVRQPQHGRDGPAVPDDDVARQGRVRGDRADRRRSSTSTCARPRPSRRRSRWRSTRTSPPRSWVSSSSTRTACRSRCSRRGRRRGSRSTSSSTNRRRGST